MKILIRALGYAATAIGIIWILQGLNILGGSFMTGQMQWAVYGAITAAIGTALLRWSRRR